MYAISECVEVNPPGASPALTARQVWKGLVMKAENALPFVAAMESCEIVERYDDGFLREIVLRGARMRERITFTPEVQVHFQRVSDAAFPGWITNLLSESERGPVLTFTFAIEFPGAAHGSSDEKARGDAVRSSYLDAIRTTLKRTRELVASGAL